VQALFAKAVHDAHATFLRIVNGHAKHLTSSGDVVYLDLRPVIAQLADQYGVLKKVQGKVQGKLPPNIGRIAIMKQNQLDAIQTAASTIKSLTVFLVIAVFGLYAIAIFLARGFRRATLRNVGVAFALVGVLLLVVQRVAGNMVIDTLATGGGNHTAGRHIWVILTSLLTDLAWAAIGYGLVVIAGAILAGPTRPAVWVRRTLAPSFREHVGLVYTVVAVLYLLVLLWAPTRAQTEWIPALVLFLALIFGVEVFRRETIKEFPGDTGGGPTPAPA
jgi:hypothetical protein